MSEHLKNTEEPWPKFEEHPHLFDGSRDPFAWSRYVRLGQRRYKRARACVNVMAGLDPEHLGEAVNLLRDLTCVPRHAAHLIDGPHFWDRAAALLAKLEGKTNEQTN